LIKEGDEFEKSIGDFYWIGLITMTLTYKLLELQVFPKRFEWKNKMVHSALATGEIFFELSPGRCALLLITPRYIAGKDDVC
jgi:hypothetical protein